jgi:hypothetical protein
MMIHLRGMARTRKNAKGDRAPRIPLIDGWQPFRVTNCGDSEGLQQTDAWDCGSRGIAWDHAAHAAAAAAAQGSLFGGSFHGVFLFVWFV